MIIKATLTGSQQRIDLSKVLDSFTHVRVRSFSYKEISTGQKDLTICIDGLNQKYDVNRDKQYFFSSLMPTYANALITYQAQDVNHFDYHGNSKKHLNGLNVHILIDDQYSADISAGNPVMIELEIF